MSEHAAQRNGAIPDYVFFWSLRLAGYGLQSTVKSYLRLLAHHYLWTTGESKDALLRAYAQGPLREVLPKRPAVFGLRAQGIRS